jgi:hypothetical protein
MILLHCGRGAEPCADRKGPALFPSPTLSLASLLFFALLVNLPLGYLRESSEKFSLRWFVLIHLSIPFIIAFRLAEGISWHAIPFTIACAVAGQLMGGYLKRRSLR